MTCDCWFPCSCVYWSFVKARKIVLESHVIDSSSITQFEALWVWRYDVTTSNSIQDGGVLVVNILVFDLRVQLQHCTYQRKTLLFALIKVITFICKREILGCSSTLKNELERLDNLWVIAAVDKPTECVSNLVLAIKKWGELRMCIDPRYLNQALKCIWNEN